MSIRLGALALPMLLLGASKPPEPPRRLELRATITEAPHAPRSGDVGRTAWAVGADPRYLVELDIASTSTDLTPLSPGKHLFFIHSPARALGGSSRRGARVRLSATVREDPPVVLSLSPVGGGRRSHER